MGEPLGAPERAFQPLGPTPPSCPHLDREQARRSPPSSLWASSADPSASRETGYETGRPRVPIQTAPHRHPLAWPLCHPRPRPRPQSRPTLTQGRRLAWSRCGRALRRRSRRSASCTARDGATPHGATGWRGGGGRGQGRGRERALRAGSQRSWPRGGRRLASSQSRVASSQSRLTSATSRRRSRRRPGGRAPTAAGRHDRARRTLLRTSRRLCNADPRRRRRLATPAPLARAPASGWIAT